MSGCRDSKSKYLTNGCGIEFVVNTQDKNPENLQEDHTVMIMFGYYFNLS